MLSRHGAARSHVQRKAVINRGLVHAEEGLFSFQPDAHCAKDFVNRRRFFSAVSRIAIGNFPLTDLKKRTERKELVRKMEL